MGARERSIVRLSGSAAHTGLLAYLFAVLFLKVPAAQQLVLELVNHFSLKASEISTNPGIDIIREKISTTETYRSRSAAFGSSRAPWRVATQLTPSSVVEMEKSLSPTRGDPEPRILSSSEPPKSPCVGEERRAGLGQTLPAGSPIVVSRVSPVQNDTGQLITSAVSYISSADSSCSPSLTSP